MSILLWFVFMRLWLLNAAAHCRGSWRSGPPPGESRRGLPAPLGALTSTGWRGSGPWLRARGSRPIALSSRQTGHRRWTPCRASIAGWWRAERFGALPHPQRDRSFAARRRRRSTHRSGRCTRVRTSFPTAARQRIQGRCISSCAPEMRRHEPVRCWYTRGIMNSMNRLVVSPARVLHGRSTRSSVGDAGNRQRASWWNDRWQPCSFSLSCASRLRLAPASVADRLPDAADVRVDVGDQAVGDELLRGHRRRVREDGPALRQLIVSEGADHRGGGRRASLEERDRLRLGAGGMLLRVPGVHLVEHGPREVAPRLPGRDRGDQVGDRLEGARQVVRGHAHRPVLRLGHLLPGRVAQLLERGDGLLNLRLELLRECFASCSHEVLLDRHCGLWRPADRTRESPPRWISLLSGPRSDSAARPEASGAGGTCTPWPWLRRRSRTTR